MQKKILNVNGVNRTVIVDPEATLADVLRKQLLSDRHQGLVQRRSLRRVLGHRGWQADPGLRHQDAARARWGARSSPSKASARPKRCIRSSWRLWRTARRSAVSARRAWSSRPKPCWTATPTPPAKKCAPGSPSTTTPAAAPATSRSWMAIMDAAKVMRGEMSREELEFKLPADGKIWGSKYPRPTAVGKVTGTLDFGQDLGLKMPPGTLQLALVQAKVSHANILSIDTSEAEKMPGVFKVVTHKDVKGKNRITGLITFPTNKGDGWDRPILCDTKVFQYGDAIAIVCADTIEQAKAAAEKVKVELEALPAYMSAPAAMADDAIEIHPGTPNVYFEQKIAKGPDTKPIMETAPYVVEDSFYLQRQPHLTIEADMGFAYFDEEDRLTIHSKSIGLYLHHAHDRARPGHRAGQAAPGREPGRRHLRLQVLPDDGSPAGRGLHGHRRPVYLEYDYQQYHAVHRQALAVLRRHQDGCRQGRQDRGHGERLDRRSWPVLRVRRPADPARRAVHRRGLQHPQHSWPGSHGLHQSCLGFSLPRLRLAAGLPGLRKPGGRTGREDRHGSAGIPLPELSIAPATPRRPARNRKSIRCPKCSRSCARCTRRPKRKPSANRRRRTRRAWASRSASTAAAWTASDGAEAWVELTKDGVTIYTTWQDHGQGADMGVLGTAHEGLRPLGIAPGARSSWC